jgi:hypothetical protein
LEIRFTGPLFLRRPNSTGLPPARAMPGFNLIADTRRSGSTFKAMPSLDLRTQGRRDLTILQR